MTRWPSSAAPTSPASGSRTSSPRSCSGRGWPPTWSNRRATSPTTRRCQAAAIATTAIRRSAPSTRRRWTRCSRPTPPRSRACARGSRRPTRARRASPTRRAVARSTPRRSTCCGACLPAASLSHMGIYATGQAYEQLILHLLGHPLPEARRYGDMILAAIKAVMPSFVARVERPERGGEWIAYLERRRAAAERWVAHLGLDRDTAAADRPSVRLLDVDGDEERLLAALLFEAAGTSEESARAAISRLGAAERAQLLSDLVGERTNRRHRPGRGYEALRYRFEIVVGLWRVPRPPAPPDAHRPVAGADARPRRRRARGGRRRGRRRRLRARARPLARGVRAARRGRARRGRAVRALPRLPDPLRARPQRPRGHAPDRAALRPRGPSGLPRGRARDARADRGGAPGRRRQR